MEMTRFISVIECLRYKLLCQRLRFFRNYATRNMLSTTFSSNKNFNATSTKHHNYSCAKLLHNIDVNHFYFSCKSLYQSSVNGTGNFSDKESDDDSSASDSDDEDDDELFNDDEHTELSQQAYGLIPGLGHRVLLLLPRIKWGPKKNSKTTPELQIAEAETLVHTLENWKVVQKVIVPCVNPDKKYIFGSGNLEKIRGLAANPEVTAVFINQNILTGRQHASLEEVFQKPVYDRHTIVLRIFLEHAKSKEAKLQVALAEIPYLKNRLRNIHNNSFSHDLGNIKYIGGAGETYLQMRKQLLFERELKLKKNIAKLCNKRRLLRNNPRRRSFPSVAVIGYTNSGKTSFIKALTQDEKIQPKPHLFATLDVTNHTAFLPCQQAVLFVDTVGFITDIPTNLIQSFTATLDDISLADLIIHIWDASHPDIVNQRETVQKTLESLKLPTRLLGSLLHVGNKVDLVKWPINLEDGEMLISATEGTGLDELKAEVERRLMLNTGMLFQSVRVPNGGNEMYWLKEWAAVQEVIVDPEDPNFLILNIVCNHKVKNMFQHHFGIMIGNRKT